MKSMNKALKTILITISIFMISLLSNFPVHAIEYFSIGGKPAYPNPEIENSSAWFIYSLKEGEKKEDAMYVINTYNDPLDLLVYAADSVKSSSGGFAVKQYVEKKEEVGSWVRFYPDPVPVEFESLFLEKESKIIDFCESELGEEFTQEQKDLFEKWCKGTDEVRLTVKSQEKILLKFVFSVPKGVSIGEHTGGILIQKIEPDTGNTQQGITLTTRVGIRIYQTVPGDIVKRLTIKSFTAKKMYDEFDFNRLIKKDLPPEEYLLTTQIENSGNVSLDFKEEISIKQLLPKQEEKVIKDRQFQVLRNDLFESNFSWNNPRIGKFVLQNNIIFEGENGQETLKSSPITIWIFPIRETIVIGGFLLFALVVVTLSRAITRKKYSGKGWEEYTVSSDETIEDISNKFEINWKKFVKTNKLKAPYVLKSGQIVLVPKKK